MIHWRWHRSEALRQRGVLLGAQAVVGTVGFEAALAALRMLEHYSSTRFGQPSRRRRRRRSRLTLGEPGTLTKASNREQ